METIMPFFPLVIFAVVGSLFVRIILSSKKKLDIEEGLTPLFTTRCGGSTGGLWYKGPFIRVAIYEDFVVLKHTGEVVLTYDEIESAELESKMGVVGKLFHIQHCRDDLGVIALMNSDDNNQKMKDIIARQLEKHPKAERNSLVGDPLRAEERRAEQKNFFRSSGFGGVILAFFSFIPIAGFFFGFFGLITCIVWWKNGGSKIFWFVLMGLLCNILLYPYLGLYS